MQLVSGTNEHPRTCLTKYFRRELLNGRGAGVWFLLLWRQCLALGIGDRRGLPSPTLRLHVPQGPEIAIASADSFPTQSNLLPAEKAATRTAEVRSLLHIWYGRDRLRWFPWWLLDMCINERLRDACGTIQPSAFSIPSSSSQSEGRAAPYRRRLL